jgi:hypothetical protein
MDFTDYLGRFPQHCHILDHEDHEMMRQFQTTNDPANCVVDGVCGPGEDCQSCPADCAQVSGASCGNGLCEGGDGENCITCPADCAGKQTGSASKQFCCGFDDGQATGPIGCGVDVSDDRCIDASADLFCRESPRLSACCGDKLCEGAETVSSCFIDCDPSACTPDEPGAEYSCSDGQDNDCDTLFDGNDPDCFDTDGDGLTDAYESNILGTDPGTVDTDGDGLVDGAGGVVSLAAYPGGIDSDGDGFVDGEQDLGTDPSVSNVGDLAPRGNPDNRIGLGDFLLLTRLVAGVIQPTALEAALGDINGDTELNVADLLLLLPGVLN